MTIECSFTYLERIWALERSRTAKQIIPINMLVVRFKVSLSWTLYTTMPVHHRAAEESTSQSKKSRRLTLENDAPSSERESRTVLLIVSIAHLEFRPGYKPAR